MSKAAHTPVSAVSLIASRASVQNFEVTALDPAVLFSGMCLLAMLVAFVFGEPGVWL